MLLAIKLLIVKYKKYNFYYTILVLNNKVLEVKKQGLDKKYSYILLFVKNIPSKLLKYQKFLS